MGLPVLPSPRLLRETLKKILEQISGVQVVWYTSKRPHLGQRPGSERAWILASIQSYRSVGIDELRQVYNQSLDRNDSIMVGQRLFTLVVNAESLDPKLQAFDLCERVRFRFRTQTARALMVPNLALVDFAPIVQHDEKLADVGGGSRTLLAATLDVRMAAVVADDPNDPGEGDYIAQVDQATGGLIPGELDP